MLLMSVRKYVTEAIIVCIAPTTISPLDMLPEPPPVNAPRRELTVQDRSYDDRWSVGEAAGNEGQYAPQSRMSEFPPFLSPSPLITFSSWTLPGKPVCAPSAVREHGVL